LSIEARNQSEKSVYVKSVTLNGKRIDRRYITNAEIMNGGRMIFEMSDRPVE
jgi:putative alpha-1,2-mannosidase